MLSGKFELNLHGSKRVMQALYFNEVKVSNERKMKRETPLWFTCKLANRARKISGVKVKKVDRMTKWLAVYAAILTTILTTFTFIEKVMPKQHQLVVYVSDYYVGSEFVEFTVAYYNSG
ncbi:hypothetical protein L4C31_20090, partial [Aliivibrio sifiae]